MEYPKVFYKILQYTPDFSFLDLGEPVSLPAFLTVATEAGQQYACKYTYDDTHPLPVLA